MPLRRVNQAFVIATSASVDVGGVDVAKFDDGYFKAEKKERSKKGEDGFFADATPEPKARRASTLPYTLPYTTLFSSRRRALRAQVPAARAAGLVGVRVVWRRDACAVHSQAAPRLQGWSGRPEPAYSYERTRSCTAHVLM